MSRRKPTSTFSTSQSYEPISSSFSIDTVLCGTRCYENLQRKTFEGLALILQGFSNDAIMFSSKQSFRPTKWKTSPKFKEIVSLICLKYVNMVHITRLFFRKANLQKNISI